MTTAVLEHRRLAPPRKKTLYPLIAIMVVSWSLNYIVAKVALREIPATLLAALRSQFAGAMILPLYLWKARQKRPSWTRRDVPLLLLLGLLGVALNQLLFVIGLSRTSVAHTAIIVGLIPMLVLAGAAALKMERITPARVAGMGLSLAGIAVLNGFNGGSHATLLGNFIVFLSAACFAVFTVFGKRVTRQHGGLTVTTFAYAASAVALAPLTLWYWPTFNFTSVSVGAWSAVLYMALFPSVIAYLIYYYALTHIPASRLSQFTYFQPLLASLVAVPVLGERLTPPVLCAGALVLGGVWVAERM